MALPAPKPTIDTCNACRKLFPRTGIRLCTHCAFVEEHRFELVREYLREHDGAAIGEIARGTGVSTSDVRRFADGGRLVQLTAGLGECSCGGVGERCRHCRAKLTNTFRRVEQDMRREQRDAQPTDGPGVQDAGRTSYVRRIRRIGES